MAWKQTCCEVIEGDFAKDDFSAFSADAFILIGALVHLPHADLEGVLANITPGR